MSEEMLAAITDMREVHAVAAVAEYAMRAGFVNGTANLPLETPSVLETLGHNAMQVYRRVKTKLANTDIDNMEAVTNIILPIIYDAMEETFGPEPEPDESAPAAH